LRCALVIVRDESGRLFLDTALQQASPLHRPPLIFHRVAHPVKRNSRLLPGPTVTGGIWYPAPAAPGDNYKTGGSAGLLFRH